MTPLQIVMIVTTTFSIWKADLATLAISISTNTPKALAAAQEPFAPSAIATPRQ